MTDVSTLLVCLTLLALWWRIEPRIDRVLDRHAVATGESAPELPVDIEQAALKWQDGHAQESYRARAREIFAESTGTTAQRWDRVRNILALEAEAT
jgi:hypothetical protein